MHTAGAETRLTGVWSPNAGRAGSLAAEFGAIAFSSFEELVDASEAIDFAVPPGVQGVLARRAVESGRAVLLEKPLAAELAAATELVAAIEKAGVANLVFFTKRYQNRTREFLDASLGLREGLLAVTGRYVHGGFLDTGFVEESSRAGWRGELGVLFDLGPHLLDLADAAAGTIRRIQATGNPSEALVLSTRHEGGAIGEFLLSGRVSTELPLTDVDLYSHSGHIGYSTSGLELQEAVHAARAEFALAVRAGASVTVDAHRALRVQVMVDAAARSLAESRPVDVPNAS